MQVTKFLRGWFEGLRLYYQICCTLNILFFLMISKKCKKADLKIANHTKKVCISAEFYVITDGYYCLTNLPAKTFKSIDNSAVDPRAVLDGDRFPSSCKKYRHRCSFIILDPEERGLLWRKGRKCVVGCRDKNYSPFIQ